MIDQLLFVWEAITSGQITTSLGIWNYVIIAVLVALEGPATTLMAAALASTGALNPVGVFLAAGLGNFSADTGWYLLGYGGRFDTLKQRFPRLRRYEAHVDALSKTIHHHATKFVIFTKLTMGVATIPTLIAAGMARVPWLKLLPASLFSEAIWTGSLVLVGLYLGESLFQINAGLQLIAVAGGVVMVLLLPIIWQQISKLVTHQTSAQSA